MYRYCNMMGIAKERSKLSHEAGRLINLCRNIGLSDEEVYNLFNEVAQLRQTNKKSSLCCKLFVGVITSVTVLFVVWTSLLADKPVLYYVEHYGENIAYPLLRGIRLITLPLSTRFDVTSLYYEDCLLDNPFLQSEYDCGICEDVRQIPVIHTVEDISFESPVYLFLWKDAVPHDVTMRDFLGTLEDNAKILRPTMKVLSSINTTIRYFSDVFKGGNQEEIHDNNYIYLLWQVRGSGALKLLRDLSWKPSFIPDIAELNPAMYIQVKGASGKRATLPLSDLDYENVWLTQSQGECHVQLSPRNDCSEKCPTVESTISARDILFFNKNYWQLSTAPTGSEVNLQFISTFY